MRILFTGGSGKAGKHSINYLVEHGHSLLNLDQVNLEHPKVLTRFADITDAGQVFDVMGSYANYDELDKAIGIPKFDAVVHFAAIPRLLMTSDNECYRVNTLGTYNVIDAAIKMGVQKVIFASSETTYGICFADGELKPNYLPIDEEHPTIPEDSYAMSKVVNEATAKSFQRRSGIDIYGLRINNVIEPHEYIENFPKFLKDPDLRRRNIFSYIDARDLGQMVQKCLNTDGLGFQIFNASNDDHSVGLSSKELIDRYYKDVPIQSDKIPQSFYSNEKAKRLLGFKPEHCWRDYI
ncbi:NAD(P)-dependent oxidoreductase [Amylibacter sp.]|jgi:nucleoside-diphosphate-sugar epimerase|nr:NAD(P)-dependent oxidoreductase [Amylibacter sp.]MDB4188406.1 NAD(P)-dependent oxidoreductase [bacterium]MDA8853040.1 NAD(P)-dependent oxidoreductase [Amylibacter sp.]MDA8913844.1 NAD(P)-dependent oxidoreductase [Amylibacter sp.]MDA9005781.1 NAD(P)-dependent oxidoreductase [Amylibacter sp.]|tara:strand:- start:173 stop:1054 length:882 start_codon:yes stop_codon:yes gene_type:complete